MPRTLRQLLRVVGLVLGLSVVPSLASAQGLSINSVTLNSTPVNRFLGMEGNINVANPTGAQLFFGGSVLMELSADSVGFVVTRSVTLNLQVTSTWGIPAGQTVAVPFSASQLYANGTREVPIGNWYARVRSDTIVGGWFGVSFDQPDVQVDSVRADGDLVTGQSTPVIIYLSNPRSVAWPVGYGSILARISPDGTSANSVGFVQATVPTIPAGGRVAVTTTGLPIQPRQGRQGFPRTNVLRAYAPLTTTNFPDDTIPAEAQDFVLSNNSASTSVDLGAADLVVESPVVPTRAASGNLSGSYAIRNLQYPKRMPAYCTESRVTLIYSADSTVDAGDTRVNQNPLATCLTDLAANGVVSYTGVLNAAGVSAGRYFLFARINADSIVDELDYTNNTAFLGKLEYDNGTLVATPTSRSITTYAGATPTVDSIAIAAGAGSPEISGLQVSSGSQGFSWELAGTTTPTYLRYTFTPTAAGSASATASITAPTDPATSGRVLGIPFNATIGNAPSLIVDNPSPTASAYTAAAAVTRTLNVTEGNLSYSMGQISLGSITYGAEGSGWLQASLSGTTAPATITLTMTPGTLAPGVYTASFPVIASAVGTTGSPNTVNVQFTVQARPVIAIAPPSLTFDIFQNGGGLNNSITVTNGGAGSLGTISSGAPVYSDGASGWLGFSFLGSSAPVNANVSANSGSLAPGTYTAKVPISGSDPGIALNPDTLLVTLNVKQRPVLSVASTDVLFSAMTSDTTYRQSIAITNSGGSDLGNVSVQSVSYDGAGSDWLSAVVSGAEPNRRLDLAASPGPLLAGTYNAIVTLIADGEGMLTSTKQVRVQMILRQRGTLGLSRTTVALAAFTDATPATNIVLAYNTAPGGSAPLGNISLSAINYSPGASGWLTPQVNITDGGATIVLRASPTGLAPANYTATFEVITDGERVINSPQTVTVEFTVSQRPVIAFSTEQVQVSAFTNAAPISRAVAVTNSGGGSLGTLSMSPVSYTLGAPGWLEATLTSTTAPSSVDFVITPQGLAPGTYYGEVTVSGTDTGLNPASRRLEVMLVVQSPPRVALQKDTLRFDAYVGGFAPESLVMVSNGGGGSLGTISLGSVQYSAGASNWLEATLYGSTAPLSLGLRPVITGLSAGTYTATVPVSGSNPEIVGGAATVTVVLNLTRRPIIVLSATSFYVVGYPDQTSVTRQVTVSNGGDGSLGTITLDPIDVNWLTATLSASTAPATVSITINPSIAPPDFSSTTLKLRVDGADVAWKEAQIIVSHFRSARGQLIVSRDSVELVQYTGGTLAEQTVEITNGLDGPLGILRVSSITYGPGASNWLAAELSSIQAPSTLHLISNASGLAAGTYEASVVLAADGTDALGTPRTIKARMTVLPRPVIAVSQSTIEFNAFTGSGPGTTTVNVTNSGAASLGTLSVSAPEYLQGAPGWLTASLSGTGAPTQLQVTATPGTLPPGTYQATLQLSADAAGVENSPLQLVVRMFVTARPTIALTQTQVNLEAFENVLGVDQTVYISNSGSGSLGTISLGQISYVSGSGNWLTTQLSGSSAPADLRLIASTVGLVPGVYEATVPVLASNPDAAGSPAIVNVRFTVKQRPRLAVSSNLLSFNVFTGNDVRRDSVLVTNAGGSDLGELSVLRVEYGSSPSGWLTAELSASTAPAQLRLSVNSGALAPGDYAAMVDIGANGSGTENSPTSVIVQFKVNARPVLSVARSSSTLNQFTAGGAVADTIAITNTGAGSLGNLSLSGIEYGAGGSGWLAATLSGTSAPSQLRLVATPGTLAAGVYTATVNVIADGAGALQTPTPVTVQFTVVGRPSIAVSETQVNLTAFTSAAAVLDTVTVTNGGVGELGTLSIGSIAYGATGSGWLTAVLSGSSAPANIVFTATPGTLAAGEYVANVPVIANGAGVDNSPRLVTVRLFVQARPVLAAARDSVVLDAFQGSTTAVRDSIAITNSGAGAITDLSLGAITHVTGSGWASATLSATTTPAQLRWQANPSGLAVGTYRATVVVSSPTAGLNPANRTLAVILRIAAVPTPTVAATDLLTGGSNLTVEQRRLLDAQGNNDGVFNLGDILALLDRSSATINAEVMQELMTKGATLSVPLDGRITSREARP